MDGVQDDWITYHRSNEAHQVGMIYTVKELLNIKIQNEAALHG